MAIPGVAVILAVVDIAFPAVGDAVLTHPEARVESAPMAARASPGIAGPGAADVDLLRPADLLRHGITDEDGAVVLAAASISDLAPLTGTPTGQVMHMVRDMRMAPVTATILATPTVPATIMGRAPATPGHTTRTGTGFLTLAAIRISSSSRTITTTRLRRNRIIR